jgi:hypothetical protein
MLTDAAAREVVALETKMSIVVWNLSIKKIINVALTSMHQYYPLYNLGNRIVFLGRSRRYDTSFDANRVAFVLCDPNLYPRPKRKTNKKVNHIILVTVHVLYDAVSGL